MGSKGTANSAMVEKERDTLLCNVTDPRNIVAFKRTSFNSRQMLRQMGVKDFKPNPHLGILSRMSSDCIALENVSPRVYCHREVRRSQTKPLTTIDERDTMALKTGRKLSALGIRKTQSLRPTRRLSSH